MSQNNPKLLNLVDYINPVLNETSQKVSLSEINSDLIQGVIDRMLDLASRQSDMDNDSRQMVGLAAVQIGVKKRIIIIDISADGSHKKQHLEAVINPLITKASKEKVSGREGCWSCGNICGNVERSRSLVLTGLDRYGKKIVFDLDDFVARIAQHEIDHLDGIRFPDRIPLDQPKNLHWVEPDQFEDYRLNWQNWPILCPRELWEDMKAGTVG